MEVCANELPVPPHGQKRHHHCLLINLLFHVYGPPIRH